MNKIMCVLPCNHKLCMFCLVRMNAFNCPFCRIDFSHAIPHQYFDKKDEELFVLTITRRARLAEMFRAYSNDNRGAS